MARSSSSFARAKSRNQPNPKILLICEDSKSSKIYLEDAARYFRIFVKVKIVHIGKTDPLGIVTAAVDYFGEYDEIYCVIDRDRHKNWDEAHELVRFNRNIKIIPSYPCFEFWLMLHFGISRKPYVESGKKSPGEACVADLLVKQDMRDYEKGADGRLFDRLLDKLPKARINSAKVKTLAKAEKEPNPSTDIHLLFNLFEKLEKKTWGKKIQ